MSKVFTKSLPPSNGPTISRTIWRPFQSAATGEEITATAKMTKVMMIAFFTRGIFASFPYAFSMDRIYSLLVRRRIVNREPLIDARSRCLSEVLDARVV